MREQKMIRAEYRQWRENSRSEEKICCEGRE